MTKEDVKRFDEIYPKIIEIAEILNISKTSLFVIAMVRLMDDTAYDHEKMLCNAAKYKDHFDFKHLVSVKDCFEVLSDILEGGEK